MRDTDGGHDVPVMISGMVPGEGVTVVSGRMLLASTGRVDGQLVMPVTDSGTVYDSLPIRGRWQVIGDSVRLEYDSRRVRWNRYYPVVPQHDTSVAGAVGDELVFKSLGGIPSPFVGSPPRVIFRLTK